MISFRLVGGHTLSWGTCCLHLIPWDGGSRFFRNSGNCPLPYTVSWSRPQRYTHHRNLSCSSSECYCWLQYNVHVKCTAVPLWTHTLSCTMCLVWYCYHPWGKPCYRINFNLLLVLLKYKENNNERTNKWGRKAIKTEAWQRKEEIICPVICEGSLLVSYTLQVFYAVCRSLMLQVWKSWKTAHGFSHQICT